MRHSIVGWRKPDSGGKNALPHLVGQTCIVLQFIPSVHRGRFDTFDRLTSQALDDQPRHDVGAGRAPCAALYAGESF